MAEQMMIQNQLFDSIMGGFMLFDSIMGGFMRAARQR